MFKGFFTRVREAFRKSEITDELYEDLEESLILADVSVQTATALVGQLREHVRKAGLKDVDAAYAQLHDLIAELLATNARPIAAPSQRPAVILVVGVNGVGKTTSIAKLAALLKRQGSSVLMAAGDTFRAAAIEQLQHWGQLLNVEVIAHQMGADPAAIVFDAIQAARARQIDYVIVDTAGRLHTKRNLMEELKKINRIIERELGHPADETLLVLDGTTGQNALVQAREFYQAVGITGLVLTKLDGTAKGGNVLSIAAEIPVSIRYIGTGERAEDMSPFDPQQFAELMVPLKGV
ncbi:MAG TPA: signal recognition particle-docking protein FtsY [Armatimonadota bacterium]|jgi:fused signal recognition particle receptor